MIIGSDTPLENKQLWSGQSCLSLNSPRCKGKIPHFLKLLNTFTIVNDKGQASATRNASLSTVTIFPGYLAIHALEKYDLKIPLKNVRRMWRKAQQMSVILAS